MNTKLFTSFLMTAFVFLLAISMVSSTVYLTQSTTTVDYTSSLTGNISVITTPTIANNQGANIAPTPVIVNNTVTFSSVANFDYLTRGNTYTGDYILTNDIGTNETVKLKFVRTFCEDGNINDNDLQFDVDVSNRGDGPDSDDFDWYPRDLIEIDVDFDNDKDLDGVGDLKDVTYELGLFEAGTGKNIAEDLEWNSKKDELIEIGNIDESDSKLHTFEFIVPSKVDAGDYILMIKVFEQDKEDITCIDTDKSSTFLYDVDISRESTEERWIIFEDVKLDPSLSQCSQDVTLTAKAYNIGDDGDQDVVKFFLAYKTWNLELEEVLDRGIDDDKSGLVDFTFTVPENADEGLHKLNLYAKYAYDKDDDDDEEYPDVAFDETSDTLKVNFNVEGKCIGEVDALEITAKLSEDTPVARIGKEVIVQSTIENTGDKEITFDLTVSGVSSWASADLSKTSVTLAAGESEIIDITLDVDNDAAAGDQEFTLTATSGSETIEQDILVELGEGGLFSSFVTGGSITDHFKSNGFIYTVIIVDAILIVAIIIAVRKMVMKKPTA